MEGVVSAPEVLVIPSHSLTSCRPMYSSSVQLGHPWPVVPVSRRSPSPVSKSKPLAPAVTIKTVGSCCWLVWLHTFHSTKDMFRPRKFFYLALKNIVWMFSQVTTFRLASSHLESPSFPLGFLTWGLTHGDGIHPSPPWENWIFVVSKMGLQNCCSHCVLFGKLPCT
jgi:hypothetical protein